MRYTHVYKTSDVAMIGVLGVGSPAGGMSSVAGHLIKVFLGSFSGMARQEDRFPPQCGVFTRVLRQESPSGVSARSPDPFRLVYPVSYS